MDESAFRTRLTALGATPLHPVEWVPGHATQDHTHPFDAYGFVLRGEFTLTTSVGETFLPAGSHFYLKAGTVHHETAGPEGTQVLGARIEPV